MGRGAPEGAAAASMTSRATRRDETAGSPPHPDPHHRATLEAELAADPDPRRQAVLRHALGLHFARDVGDEALAAETWLEAYRGHPPFRLPLHALLGLFERRRRYAQREKLLLAEERSAASEGERASALLDRAILLAGPLGRGDEADALLDKAVREGAGRGAAAAWLEERARARGDGPTVARALEALERAVLDEELVGLLRLERATLAAATGDVDGAARLARAAAEVPPTRFRALRRLEALAREHGRAPLLLEALERQAALAAAFAADDGARPTDGGFRDAADAALRGAALCWEASRIRVRHGDPAGAAEVLGTAVALRPDAPVLGQERIRALERVGDHAGAAREARRLLDRGASGGYAAWLWFRVAAGARATDAPREARDALERALDADATSIPCLGSLDDALLDAEAHGERIARLERRGGALPGRARTLAYWQAAQIAADDAGDVPWAERLYREAETGASPEDRRSLRRERLGAALRGGDAAAARDAGRALLDAGPDAEERGAVLRMVRDLALFDLGDDRDADATLSRALDDPAARAWAPDAARLRGAITRDPSLLAAAHLRLGEDAGDRWTRAAHRCAAARALARGGDADGARAALEAALRDTPGHPYAAPLLEALLADEGDGEALLRRVRETPDGRDPRATEEALLRAGAANERRGAVDAAIEAYREASDWDATSPAPLHALRRLGRVEGRPDVADPAVEALAAREVAGGAAGDATLELAERHALAGDDPSLAEGPLLAALDRPELAPAAALAAALLPPSSPGVVDAERVLADHCGVAARGRADRMAPAYEALGALEAPDGDRAAALDTLADRAAAPASRRALRLAAVRAALAAGDGDRARAVAATLAREAPASEEARVAAEEGRGAGSSVGWQALADACPAPQRRVSLEAAALRARLTEGDAGGALPALVARVEATPDDLAAWESLRVAARDVGDRARLAEASQRLADAAPPELAGALLEEAGAALADLPGRADDAIATLERAVRVAPEPRRTAVARLDALLAARSDPAARAALTDHHLAHATEPAERAALWVREATLHAEAGSPAQVEAALERALEADPTHREALERLAARREAAGRPAEAATLLVQAARAGDADGRLAEAAVRLLLADEGDHGDAVEEALGLLARGPVERARWLRLADLAEAAGAFPAAATALRAAARSGEPTERRIVHARLASLAADRLGDATLAREALANLHALAPDDADVLARRLAHLEGPARADVAADALRRARALLAHDPVHPGGLALLAVAAGACGDASVARRAGALAAALDGAGPSPCTAPEAPGPPLAAADLDRLRSRGDAGPLAALARDAEGLLARALPVDPAALGARGQAKGSVPEPVREALAAWAARLGVDPPEAQPAPGLGPALALVPSRRGRPLWLVGEDVRAPLDPARRFAAAQLLFALRDGLLPIACRPAADAALPLLALGAALDVPMLGAASRPELPELAAAVRRALSRKERRALAERAARATEDGADAESWALWAHASCLRAGLVGCDDPRVVLEAATGAALDREAVRATPLGRELARFLVSDELGQLESIWRPAPGGTP